jgi:hypothetical protein
MGMMIMVAMVVMVASFYPRGVLGGDSLLAVLDSTVRAMEGGGVYNRCEHIQKNSGTNTSIFKIFLSFCKKMKSSPMLTLC